MILVRCGRCAKVVELASKDFKATNETLFGSLRGKYWHCPACDNVVIENACLEADKP